MTNAPYFPKYAKDWLTGEGTRLMTPEQRGAFDWLLCHAWLSDPPCSLPDDDTALARLSDLGRRWKSVGRVVRAQFQPHPEDSGRIYNPKQLAVWTEMEENRKRRSAAGRKGNAMRWDSDSQPDRNAIAKPSPASASASTSTEKKKEKPSVSPKKSARDLVEGYELDSEMRDFARKRGLDADAILPEWLDHFRGTGYRTKTGPVADPGATFRTWLRNAQKFGSKPIGQPNLPTFVAPMKD